jgi:hypothetical protein
MVGGRETLRQGEPREEVTVADTIVGVAPPPNVALTASRPDGISRFLSNRNMAARGERWALAAPRNSSYT